MNPDDVYALLVDANPVPVRDTPASARVATDASAEHRSDTMVTLSHESTEQHAPPEPDRRWHLVAAAAAVVAVVAIGAFLLSRDDPAPQVPAGPVVTSDETLPAVPSREERAVAATATFYRAAYAGDVETVVEMSNIYGGNIDADRRMWEMIAVTGILGEPMTVGDCAARPGANALYVEVDCQMVSNDPVWIALGVSEVEAPALVFDDGTVAWQAWEGADWRSAQRAYSEYVRAFHADEFEAACDPSAYEPGSVNVSNGMALTPECAELWVPLGADVVEWIADGRPTP